MLDSSRCTTTACDAPFLRVERNKVELTAEELQIQEWRRIGLSPLRISKQIGQSVSQVLRTLAKIRVKLATSETLTNREIQVVKCLAEGLSNKRIADRLGFSNHTAKFHVRNLLRKIDATTRAEGAAYAVRNGLA